MFKRFSCFILLVPGIFFLYAADAGAQGWTFTEEVTQTGQCIPYPRLPSLVYATKSACEASRSAELANNGDDWSVYGDGSCVTIITCTPCTGSDVGSGSGGSSFPGDPGDVSMTGLLSGNPFFSPHDSKDIENWIRDYMLRMNALGIQVDGVIIIEPDDVPRTGDNDFDRFYTEQMLRFEKPEQGGTVYLNSNATGIVNPDDLKNPGKTTSTTATAPVVAPVSKPAPGLPGYVSGYDFYAMTDPSATISRESGSGKSFTDRLLTLAKEVSKNGYSKWVGNLADEVCSNITAATEILGSPEARDLTAREAARFDEKTVLVKASANLMAEESISGIVGTVTGQAVKIVEAVGEKISLKMCRNVSADIVKADYKTGLEAGKIIIDKSTKAAKYWGILNN